jgi:membrane protein DedA with SNARE-associated domain
VEGHVISLVIGFLARLGLINPFLGGALVAVGNLLGDIVWYWVGFYKGESAVRRWGKYFGITEKSVAWAKKTFHSHHSRILLISKLTNGFGFSIAILFSAGVSRISFKTYMKWNIIGECLWTGTLVTLGYLLGNLYTSIDAIFWRVGVISFGTILAILLLLMINRLSKNFTNQ